MPLKRRKYNRKTPAAILAIMRVQSPAAGELADSDAVSPADPNTPPTTLSFPQTIVSDTAHERVEVFNLDISTASVSSYGTQPTHGRRHNAQPSVLSARLAFTLRTG